jgi:hypothetical protein
MKKNKITNNSTTTGVREQKSAKILNLRILETFDAVLTKFKKQSNINL